ncbi:hypothetical protein XH98_11275 [Bradyrhizobium sp. CCBAU 51745]|uniref:hypothetical protein n=1 Tax=Bradyrhizobium sp. CCBAU 51745 TaxID=1325099 RepID=UPI0023050213|nr:hypothetical protein [Bradyrhizobium sp. CCBAU 51745]MDA9439699.1 hypothetical protein [Bradyrhizobium sp. CCBAU 51745]
MTDFRDQRAASELEKRIRDEIAERQAKIRELQNEIHSFEQMLLKARRQNELVRRSDVSRKNSVGRVLIESSVLETLAQTGRVRGTRSLYQDARLIVGTLKEGTFRTTLHRMKNRGLIVSVGNGKWQITPSGIKLVDPALLP